jgi:hypothetical protein
MPSDSAKPLKAYHEEMPWLSSVHSRQPSDFRGLADQGTSVAALGLRFEAQTDELIDRPNTVLEMARRHVT